MTTLASLCIALSDATERHERAQQQFLGSAETLADELINGGEDVELMRVMLRDFDRDFLALEMARGVYAQARRELELAQAERVEEVTA